MAALHPLHTSGIRTRPSAIPALLPKIFFTHHFLHGSKLRICTSNTSQTLQTVELGHTPCLLHRQNWADPNELTAITCRNKAFATCFPTKTAKRNLEKNSSYMNLSSKPKLQKEVLLCSNHPSQHLAALKIRVATNMDLKEPLRLGQSRYERPGDNMVTSKRAIHDVPAAVMLVASVVEKLTYMVPWFCNVEFQSFLGKERT